MSVKPRKNTPKPRTLTPAQIPLALERFAAPAGTDRYAAGKALVLTADKAPDRLYPHFDALVPFLSSDTNIIRWNALRILAALAPVDSCHKLDALLDTFFAFITGANMISAANAILACGTIARARPDLLRRIVAAILQVESATYETPECRNVAIAHTLDVFTSLWPVIAHKPAVRAFVQRQQSNPRPSAAKRAKALLARPVGIQNP
jgi:hypothetical protein